MYETVHVGLGARSYDIKIGTGLLENAASFIAPVLKRPKICVVTDANVAEFHLKTLEESLKGAGIVLSTLVLEPGEKTKSWQNLEKVVEWLLAEKIERDDYIVAFGGGVIGDLVGFSAAILRRGVDFIQIPTSLLAQVDSSVGGKTGINSVYGKNLIGAFHQPRLVLADIGVLDTLPPREFMAGYAEVLKYGLLGNFEFFEWLEAHGERLKQGDQQAIAHAVKTSCQMKADIVGRDEKEKGDRALLNLGHTFGHALESATGYSARLLHGEGVSIGMGLAFETSARLGLCSQEAPSRVMAHLKAMGMKAKLSDIEGDLPDVDGLISLMEQDKKVSAGVLTFILVRDIGEAFIAKNIDMSIVRAVLTDALAER